MKMAVDKNKMNFRPKISLPLANMTMTADGICKHLTKKQNWLKKGNKDTWGLVHTNISE